jgi:ankyrin repeat protein
MVYSLSNAGIDVNMVDSNKNTPLHLAFMRGPKAIDVEFVEALLKVGVDIYAKNNDGHRPSQYLSDNQKFNEVYEAHKPGLWEAVESNDKDLVTLLTTSLFKINLNSNL